MPAETFGVWLRPHIEAYGSLLGERSAAHDYSGWAKEFRGRPISFWSKVRWRRVEGDLSELPLEQRSHQLAKELATRFAEFESTGSWRATGVTDSLQRLSQLVHYVRANGTFPAPLVCLAADKEWLLLDGQHRLGAAVMVRGCLAGPVVVWLGEDDI